MRTTAESEAYIDKMGELWSLTDQRYKDGIIDRARWQKYTEYYHRQAEKERAKLGYSGGTDGSEYTIISAPSSGNANAVYDDGYSDVMDEKKEMLETDGTMGIARPSGKPLPSAVILIGVGAVLLLILGK